MDNLNKNIKVFFIDLDGTLLDEKKDGKHWISDANVKAIKNFQRQGKHVVISTGRFGEGVQPFIKRTGVKYAVTGNGARVVDNKGKIYKDDPLTIKQSLLVFNFAKKYKLTLKLDGDAEAWGVISKFQKYITTKFGFYGNNNYNMPMHQEYYKIVLWGKTKRRMAKIGRMIGKQIENVSVVSSSMGWTIEITNKKSTKGLANKYVANQLLGIKNKEAMAHIGDTLNDSTAKDYMRLIAMSDGFKGLIKLADYVGPSYKNGGVGKILIGGYRQKGKPSSKK